MEKSSGETFFSLKVKKPRYMLPVFLNLLRRFYFMRAFGARLGMHGSVSFFVVISICLQKFNLHSVQFVL